MLTLKDITINNVFYGFIHSINEKGVLIFLSNGIRSFAPKSLLLDSFVTEIREFYQVGQTVKCFVVKPSNNNYQTKIVDQKIIVSLKQIDTFNPSLLYIQSYFDEKLLIDKISSGLNLINYKMGSKIKGKVKI